MARFTRFFVTLVVLFFIQPSFHMAYATTHTSARAVHKTTSGSTKNTTKKAQSGKGSKKEGNSTSKKATPVKTSAKTKKAATSVAKNSKKENKSTTKLAVNESATFTQKCTRPRKGYKTRCVTVKNDSNQNLTIAQAHKARYQSAQKTALNKLMGQIGKPYHWGGTSPRTGFDCSGLVYYAYKDLVKFRIPRTANEMYHLRDASPVDRSQLESGDLVFFRTQGRGTADHVGVYVGNGKFIQSPRSGQDIQITSLSEDYWQRHYVGARRVMTPKTIR